MTPILYIICAQRTISERKICWKVIGIIKGSQKDRFFFTPFYQLTKCTQCIQIHMLYVVGLCVRACSFIFLQMVGKQWSHKRMTTSFIEVVYLIQHACATWICAFWSVRVTEHVLLILRSIRFYSTSFALALADEAKINDKMHFMLSRPIQLFSTTIYLQWDTFEYKWSLVIATLQCVFPFLIKLYRKTSF